VSAPGNSGPAFPSVELDQVTGSVCDQHFGLSLRDYFAAKAMASLIVVSGTASHSQLRAMVDKAGAKDGQDWAAITAYQIADEMLKARQQ
jgi:hypothetical protein